MAIWASTDSPMGPSEIAAASSWIPCSGTDSAALEMCPQLSQPCQNSDQRKEQRNIGLVSNSSLEILFSHSSISPLIPYIQALTHLSNFLSVGLSNLMVPTSLWALYSPAYFADYDFSPSSRKSCLPFPHRKRSSGITLSKSG